MNIQIDYSLLETSEGVSNLYDGWRRFMALRNVHNHLIMVEEGEDLTRISDDGNKGRVILHYPNGDPVIIDELPAAQFAQEINAYFLEREQLSRIKSLKAKAIPEEQVATSLEEPDFLTNQQIEDAIEDILEEQPDLVDDLVKLKELAVARIEDKPKVTRVRRRGIPVRGRYLPQYPDGKPWETAEWFAELERRGIGPDDPLPEGFFEEYYNPFYRKTPAHIRSQAKYGESKLGQTQQHNFFVKNPTNKDLYSEEFLASLTEEEYYRTGPDAIINPRWRHQWGTVGQSSRQASIKRIDERDKRYDVLAQAYKDAGVSTDDYEVKKQLWLEGFMPQQESRDPETGLKGPIDIEKFNRWYNKPTQL